MKSLSHIIFIIFLMTVQFLPSKHAHPGDIPPPVKKLVERLHMDGLEREYLQDLFSRPELKLMHEAVARSLVRKESDLNYAQFLEKDSVDRAISYLSTHRSTLEKTESHFNISALVVVAILSVESACGRFTGSVETVNILATQALSSDPEISRQISDQIPSEEKSSMTPQGIEKRLRKKSIRGYQELKAFLAYVKDLDIDPFSVKGSVEGAIGLPQFLPSNIKTYGFDGDGDGQIDVFQHEDAIPSIASYLKAYHWKDNNNYRRKEEILLKYNHSRYYATTVLELADRLASYWH